ncbi:transposase [Microvirga tunisiensis]|uniref:Transposase n=1 Tax=Microvirga tunisiensis TaxID=2108360 RepID=A0A5N7MN89_9HYPH|nr:transposase [Microvirga tunisiensis]MPR10167.1 transposase [Microvirga tunisiensis]MPR28373.1 transposase [Microvirga tunisiensis]
MADLYWHQSKELSVSVSVSAPMSDDRSFHVLEAIPSRLEVGPDRPRRRWSVEAKMALIEEPLKPGANVSAIARQAGISPAQLFGWRRKAMQAGVVQCAAHEQRLGFVEVTSPSSAMIEMVVAGVVVRVGADIDQNHLAKILRAVRQA